MSEKTKQLKVYSIQIGLNGSIYDEFWVDATEFSVALDKALNYIEVEGRRKDIDLRKDIFTIVSIVEKDNLKTIKTVSGKTVANSSLEA